VCLRYWAQCRGCHYDPPSGGDQRHARRWVPYQINFISPALSGIRAAVSAGLGATARSVEMLNPQFRALAEKEGLPRMPDVNFYLYLAGLNSNPIARQLFESCGR
jgi:DNA-binding transcriptional LysR family regulator